jgi:hypothetical protein
LFVTVLFISILLAILGQPYRVLGVELVARAAITGVGLLILDRRASVDPTPRDGSVRDRLSTEAIRAPGGTVGDLLPYRQHIYEGPTLSRELDWGDRVRFRAALATRLSTPDSGEAGDGFARHSAAGSYLNTHALGYESHWLHLG